jgi:hypothetical protein
MAHVVGSLEEEHEDAGEFVEEQAEELVFYWWGQGCVGVDDVGEEPEEDAVADLGGHG